MVKEELKEGLYDENTYSDILDLYICLFGGETFDSWNVLPEDEDSVKRKMINALVEHTPLTNEDLGYSDVPDGCYS